MVPNSLFQPLFRITELIPIGLILCSCAACFPGAQRTGAKYSTSNTTLSLSNPSTDAHKAPLLHTVPSSYSDTSSSSKRPGSFVGQKGLFLNCVPQGPRTADVYKENTMWHIQQQNNSGLQALDVASRDDDDVEMEDVSERQWF